MAVLQGSGKPLIRPPQPPTFQGKEFGRTVATGTISGGLNNIQKGVQATTIGAAKGGLIAGISYITTHSTGTGPMPSNNLDSWKSSVTHPAPSQM